MAYALNESFGRMVSSAPPLSCRADREVLSRGASPDFSDRLDSMSAAVFKVEEIEADRPIDKLTRRRVFGSHMLWAHVQLAKGCVVQSHSHPNEQIAFVVSGSVLWKLGQPGSEDYREVVVEGGTAIHLPSDFPHGVEALEDSLVLDVLSPPGEMGIDRQGTS